MAEAPYAQAPSSQASGRTTGLNSGTSRPINQSTAVKDHSNNASKAAERMPRMASLIHRLHENAKTRPVIWVSAASLTAANKGPMTTRTMYLVNLSLTTSSKAQISHSNKAFAHVPDESKAKRSKIHALTSAETEAMPHHPNTARASVTTLPGTNHHARGPRKCDHAWR